MFKVDELVKYCVDDKIYIGKIISIDTRKPFLYNIEILRKISNTSDGNIHINTMVPAFAYDMSKLSQQDMMEYL